ncbi:hypothetical protein CXF85_01040 [Colwellia sp. 75C3]|uniref:hypothetical protein n=1 Tax=Colwellia sp. 75C3 TaxID=888425 RepID=UPI000C33DBED|nr:hypothetical protein [Colwellia sp. 75C3]PKG86318.1 hypothetical protein CXF85_01040 [Colwellia sp. 75C3]
MCLAVSNEFVYMENWLVMLLSTYNNNPSTGLAHTINFYVDKLLRHDDINFYGNKRCEYLAMQRYWRWQGANKRDN